MQGYIVRKLEREVIGKLSQNPVTAILGPRQCGKSTLAKKVIEHFDDAVYLDLERASDRAKLRDPEAFFSLNKNRLMCLDEIQRMPEIFEAIRPAVDEDGAPRQFLILGSASRDLIAQSSETLAGRISYLELTRRDETTPAARWVPAQLPCAKRSGELRVADGLHPHVHRTRPSDSLLDHAESTNGTSLEDVRSLPRAAPQ